VAFHYATSPDCPPFWDTVWHAHNIWSILGAVDEQIRYFVTFHWIPEGIFLRPRNLSNLMTQMSVTAIIAVGMLMVIVSGNIDLSVGSVLGLAGGAAAYSLSVLDYSLPTSIALAIIIAVLIGVFQGTLIAYL